MTNIAENINKLMDMEGINASELSRLTGINRSILHKILTGSTKNPTLESIKPIIKHYGFDEVVYGASSKSPGTNEIPILSWAEAAQFPSCQIFKTNRKYVLTNLQKSHNVFGVLVEYTLDSRFPKDTLLIIDHDRTPKNLSYVIVNEGTNNVASLKRFILDGCIAYLKSIDSTFPSVKYDPENFRIVGVVIQSIFDYE